MQNVYVSFDISTSTIGISLFNENFELIDLSHISLKNSKNVEEKHRFLVKAEVFEEYLHSLNEYNILGAIVEEALKNSNNINTNNKLVQFNGVCSYNIYKILKVKPIFITVHDARKALCPEFIKYNNKSDGTLSFPKDVDKKNYIYNKIRNYYPFIKPLYGKGGVFKKENYDMSDAVAVGLAHFIKKGYINHEKLQLLAENYEQEN